MNKTDENYLRYSRFSTINLMRNACGKPPLIWEKFKNHSWKLIEEITEDERIKYNKE